MQAITQDDAIALELPTKRKRGRPFGSKSPKTIDVRALTARGIHPVTAGEILKRACDEMTVWRQLLSDDDKAIVLRSMIFLTTMRDGSPSQRIDVTQKTLNLTMDDLARAEAIVQELRLAQSYSAQSQLETSSPSMVNVAAASSADDNNNAPATNQINDSIMVSGDEGAGAVVVECVEGCVNPPK